MNRRDFLKVAGVGAGLLIPQPPPYKIYLPIVSKSKGNVGVENEGGFGNLDKYYNPHTRLKVSVRWSDVEFLQGYYDWSSLDGKLGSYHADWITVKMTPAWALPDGEPVCKLPTMEYWGAFHKFAQAVIDRYHPEYLEIWNEPNISYELMNPDHAYQYGCVGDAPLYGEFVEKLYHAIDGAKVIAGAVSNVDPHYMTAMFEETKGYYDGLSIHCYEYFDSILGDTCLDNFTYAETLTDKPVYLSETAVYYVSGDIDDYYDAQIAHYRRLETLPTPWFWYTIGYNGWPTISTDMIGPDGPRPIWNIYRNDQ